VGRGDGPRLGRRGHGAGHAPGAALAHYALNSLAAAAAANAPLAALRPRQQASRPTWFIFAAAAVALTAWILTPPDDPFAAALTS